MSKAGRGDRALLLKIFGGGDAMPPFFCPLRPPLLSKNYPHRTSDWAKSIQLYLNKE
ncbi:hypothetical protein [Candidatus Electronema sp. JC]|uniref:hypothetical protein n=1 Tax=Candidatus Electronema sp. JC TaxID=3401570 RepID=UPI003B427D91